MANTTSKSFGIHWFRRDLRVAGNPALKHNWKANDGRTLGIFCFDHKFLSRPDFSVNRFQFFLETLKSLKTEFENIGGDLLVLNQAPEESFPFLINLLNKQKYSAENLQLPSIITWNRDYEPYARARDEKMAQWFKSSNIPVETFRDHLIIEPDELVKNGSKNEGYQVYSPFARKWLDLISDHSEIKSRVQKKELGFDYIEKLQRKKHEKIFKLKWKDVLKDKTPKDHLIDFLTTNSKKVTVKIPKSGTLAAFNQLTEFKNNLKDYQKSRDIPGLDGTSKMSIFLKNGSLTTAHIIAELNLKPYLKAENSASKYYSELIWREFYYHILFRNPQVESESFNPNYKNIKWSNNEKWFESWKEGKTGFPIVDAGMRQLKTTGWMHNRVRMIVASFLTKDLLIDWRWGEKHFMELLLDGDLAPNNGGWQWAASTGCDPQPYFRIFNPWLQGAKFDPKGEYIKTYIPELKDTDTKALHTESALRSVKYPRPIVDHGDQRLLALKLYKG